MSVQPSIAVTSQDFDRLQEAINTLVGLDAEKLDMELARAKIVDPVHVPPNLVTMNSTLTYQSLPSGEEHTISLVYPKDADASGGRISVLAPLGSAILGLTEGQEIAWGMPGGARRLRILKVVYQPEAAGDWHL